jgi:hypothetical protein
MGLVMAMPSEASADYLVSVWQNNTNMIVNGSYRWGAGPWIDFSIAPGTYNHTWLNLRGSPPFPLIVRFDADPGPGVDYVTYQLRTYKSPTTVADRGPTEVFVIRPDGRLDLQRTRL